MNASWSRRISSAHAARVSSRVFRSWPGTVRSSAVAVFSSSATGAMRTAAAVNPSTPRCRPDAASAIDCDCAAAVSPMCWTLRSSCANASGKLRTASRNASPNWSRTASANRSWGAFSSLQV